MNNSRKRMGSFLPSLLIFFIAYSLFSSVFGELNSNEVNINQAIEEIQEGNVKRIDLKNEKLNLITKDDKNYVSFVSKETQNDFYNNYLKDKVENGQIEYYYNPGDDFSKITSIVQILMTGLLIFLFFKMFTSKNQAGQDASKFSKSRAILHDANKDRITFNDIAGLKEEKEELYEIVDFLKNPERFRDLGAKIPKGILMVGPPGTGKTYISRAVAGEAGVPFFSISGSDFVEMFVGVGASRVRSMFEEAKKNSPCIIFIDEIDAVGRQRGTGLGGGHDEREQTLNQLLVEMDGFSTNEGIIMIAATNRPDILDKALLRPGRFDRTIHIGIPDIREREEILKIHTKNKPIGANVSLKEIASATTGFTPADLENLTNEAAILTARDHRKEITSNDFQNAKFKIIAGPEKKSRLVTKKERILTAYHEAGHAITQSMIEGMDPVDMITIIPRGGAGGFTSFRQKEEKSFMTKGEMKNEIVTLLGGRAAEALILDDISTGASNDIQRATKIARHMVTTYGMSDKFGPVSFSDDGGMPFVGRDMQSHHGASEKTRYEIENEIRTIVDTSYQKAINILKDNKLLLEKLSQKLLEKETIREEEFDTLVKEYKEGKDGKLNA
ncbi:MAG: ATP-dependent zinc metalloprotease FtsH [Anaerococcus sp.]